MTRLASANESSLSVGEMILLAMLRCGGRSCKCLEYDDIVVEAWRLFPEKFSLGKYIQHPDASNIHKQLYGPLKARKLIEPCGSKTFALSATGLLEAQALAQRTGILAASAPTQEAGAQM